MLIQNCDSQKLFLVAVSIACHQRHRLCPSWVDPCIEESTGLRGAAANIKSSAERVEVDPAGRREATVFDFFAQALRYSSQSFHRR